MGTIATILRHVLFERAPEDGKTPIWDTVSGKWVMTADPTVQQMAASENKLKDVTEKAAAAQAEAAGKVTEAEALAAVRTDVFEVTLTSPLGHPAFRSIELVEGAQGSFKVWVNFGAKGAPPTSATRGWLDYADNDTVNDLMARVAAIERKLGIT